TGVAVDPRRPLSFTRFPLPFRYARWFPPRSAAVRRWRFRARRDRPSLNCPPAHSILHAGRIESFPMRIDQLFGRQLPTVSFEFFPPKNDAGFQQLYRTIEDLRPLKPSYVS